MFLPDKKKMQTIIQARFKDGLEKRVESKSEENVEGEGPCHECAETIMAAIQEKSVTGLSDALEKFYQYIKAEDIKQDNEE